jgi:SsrA-binding protein
MKNGKAVYGQVQIRNKKAKFEYELKERFIAGLVLTGTEIKSIRLGNANLQDAYCVFERDELWIQGMHISPYDQGSHYNHDPLRKRKLLLNKNELRKLKKITKDVGITIIPLRLFINERGLAKLEIATGRGKKLYDKRQDIRKKDEKREIGHSRFK